jgi:hypothetical protein
VGRSQLLGASARRPRRWRQVALLVHIPSCEQHLDRAPPAGFEPATHGLGMKPGESRCVRRAPFALVRSPTASAGSGRVRTARSKRWASGWAEPPMICVDGSSGAATRGATPERFATTSSSSQGRRRCRSTRLVEGRRCRVIAHRHAPARGRRTHRDRSPLPSQAATPARTGTPANA